MTEETTRSYEVVDEAEFDFSYENFREVGYSFKGTVTTAEVRKVPERTYERKDGSGSFTIPEHLQFVVWARPTSGGEGKDWKIVDTPYTMNKNSVMGRFVEEATKAGITFKKPGELLGRTFEFERLEKVKFGKQEANPFFVIRAEDKGAAGIVSSPASSRALSDEVAAELAQLFVGKEEGSLIQVITTSPLRSDAKVVAAVASGKALRELKARGLVKTEGTTLMAV